jgi:YebC/PmpR family DNA-binding regulatory protein
MSGHSKWATIKRKKGKADQERGKIFTRLIKEISIAAREGGGDPEGNPRLRTAIAGAKAANMPQDNIKRAILKGTGELPGVKYESVTYEGYGPSGVAIYLEVMTDNKNRVVSEIRHILTKFGGNLGASGCVAWMFDKKGYIVVEKSAADEETLMEKALEAGAEDVREDDDCFEVISAPEAYEDVKAALDSAGIATVAAEVTMVPQNMAPVDGETAAKLIRLIDALEDCDDVQKVYTNADLPDDIEE